MPLSRRRSRHRHRAAHGTEHPVHPVPAWTDDEQWFEPDDAHTGWVGQLHHEPAPWRSEYAPPDDYAPPQNYPRLPTASPPPDYPAPPVDPRGTYRPQPEYAADDYDGYEQQGPDETPALRGRLIRLPRRRAELPEAVRDCLHWGIFALVLVPVFLVATGGSVLNAIVVMISILVLGVVVIWVVRLGKVALPNLEPAHQLEPVEPEVQDPIEDEWDEVQESDVPGGDPYERPAPGDWHEPPPYGADWPEPPGPNGEWSEPSWEPYLPPQPSEHEHVGWRRDQ